MNQPISGKKSRPNKLASVTINNHGIQRTMREWCQLLSLNYSTVRMRYIRGERDADTLLKPTPVSKSNPFDAFPKSKKLAAVTYTQAFYDLPVEVRELVRSECEFDPQKVRNYITKAVIAYLERSSGQSFISSPTKKSTDQVKYIDISDLEDMLPDPTGSSAKYFK
jgi:hypothetical protein